MCVCKIEMYIYIIMYIYLCLINDNTIIIERGEMTLLSYSSPEFSVFLPSNHPKAPGQNTG